MARQRNGTGSLYQRSDGFWSGQLQINGRRVTVYGKTKTEARKKLDELCHQAKVHGGLPERQTLYVLLDRFLEVGAATWRPRTCSEYQTAVAVTKDQLGDLPLEKMTPSRIQALCLAF